jgi:hypothetical protein
MAKKPHAEILCDGMDGICPEVFSAPHLDLKSFFKEFRLEGWRKKASAHDSNARFFWWFVSVLGMSKSSGRLVCPCDGGVLPCHPVCDGNEDDDDDE